MSMLHQRSGHDRQGMVSRHPACLKQTSNPATGGTVPPGKGCHLFERALVSHRSCLNCRSALAVFVGDSRECVEKNVYYVLDVLVHCSCDHFPGNRLLTLMPGVIIGAHGCHCVTDSCFPCQYG